MLLPLLRLLRAAAASSRRPARRISELLWVIFGLGEIGPRDTSRVL